MKNKEKYLDEICSAITSQYPTIRLCHLTYTNVFHEKDCCKIPSCEVCKAKLKEWLKEEYKEYDNK